MQKSAPFLFPLPEKKPVVRCLALAGVIGPVLFVAVFTLLGFLRPGYSPVRQAISDLGVGPNGWIGDGFGLLNGLLLIAFAMGFALSMRSVLPPLQRRLSAVLLALHGLAYLVVGLFTEASIDAFSPSLVGSDTPFFWSGGCLLRDRTCMASEYPVAWMEHLFAAR